MFLKLSKYFVLAVFSLLLLTAGVAYSQGNQGSIRGTVLDSTGASLPDVTVVVTSEATGVAQTVKTSDNGFFSADSLTPGQYSLKGSREGFSPILVEHVQVDPGQVRETSLSLQIGTSTQTVTVTADAVAVETQDSASGGTISAKQVENLMLNGRNFQSMGQLIPGVSSTAGNNQESAGGLTGGTTLIVNGMSIEYSVYTLDGIYNMNTGNLGNINVLPIVDSIDEFRILKDNYSARYGLAGSGQVIVQTKSGGDKYHGSAWDYFRNDALDANNYFTPSGEKQKLRQNIFGYSLGGPIAIPHLFTAANHKSFFFASNEWRRVTSGSTLQGSVFDAAQRAGTFTAPITLERARSAATSSARSDKLPDWPCDDQYGVLRSCSGKPAQLAWR